MTPHLISVIGSSPGVGKSTLCRALAGWLSATGASVDHFAEEDILTREEFRPVAEEFADGSAAVRPETLTAAMRAYVAASTAAGRDYLVTDALLPFIPSLVAWGHDERALCSFVDRLSRVLGPVPVTVVYVHDDPATALRRAVAREGAGWEDWYLRKLAGSPGTRSVRDLPSAAAHLRTEAELTRRLLARTPWHVVTVDVSTLDAEQTFASARDRLADRLGPSTCPA
ncbi:hypothetical protein [Streptomyces sp. enrichment culture]|uniref:hypothetical protein n=1 Tax=Streptomyces sp. enrichment culture TaxID=1795815 RepID=UPI003F563F55